MQQISGKNQTPVTESDDPGYRVIKGRRWRISDPAIPEPLRQSLVNELMSARRAVGQALREHSPADEAAARSRVQAAKVALGERGPRWWQTCDHAALCERAEAALCALLNSRAAASTVCPSEIARIIDGEGWRRRMDLVRQVALDGIGSGRLVVLQKGQPAPMPLKGPIRIGRGPAFPSGR